MKNDEYQYEGKDVLEAMQEARNYNAYLRNLIRKYAEDTTMALDFGAGIGDFAGTLGVPPGKVTCIEPDTEARNNLASRGFETHASLSAVDSDRFTYLFSLNVLEHIEDDIEIVGELYRVVRPGARIFIYVPAFNLLYSALDTSVGHHRRYTIRGMRKILKNAGFDIEDSAYVDALGFFATLACKILFSKSDSFLNKSSVRFYDRFIFPVSRIISPILSGLLGRNLYVVARKPKNAAR